MLDDGRMMLDVGWWILDERSEWDDILGSKYLNLKHHGPMLFFGHLLAEIFLIWIAAPICIGKLGKENINVAEVLVDLHRMMHVVYDTIVEIEDLRALHLQQRKRVDTVYRVSIIYGCA